MLQCQHLFCVFCVIINICDDQSQEYFLHKWRYVPLRLWRHLWKNPFPINRLLALRGHVTNGSFKQWLGILLMTKIDRVHKNYLTREIWEETHLREIFYGTLIFQQSSMICIAGHVGGHTFTLQHDTQATWQPKQLFAWIMFDSYAQMCCKRYHIIFLTFPSSLRECKISAPKEVIHSFKNQILVTWPATNILILRKWCGFEI